jgi:hypothetical protein
LQCGCRGGVVAEARPQPISYTDGRMDAEQSIAEIERLERIFAVPDTRPLNASDLAAANGRHDDKLANSPWFRLWQRYGVCCRAESPLPRIGELES